MSYYVNKNSFVEAFKWTGDVSQEEDPAWIVEAMRRKDVKIVSYPIGKSFKALEMIIRDSRKLGVVFIAKKGDYIVKNKEGIIFPVKADVFDLIYGKILEVNE